MYDVQKLIEYTHTQTYNIISRMEGRKEKGKGRRGKEEERKESRQTGVGHISSIPAPKRQRQEEDL